MMINKLFILYSVLNSCYVVAAQAPWVGSTLEDIPCEQQGQGFGPFDYSKRATIDKHNLTIVEENHLTPEVENLIKGKTSDTPEGDLNYTLRAWPNHHRALLSIINYQLNIKNKIQKKWNGTIDKLNTPPECYLQRAMHFSPKDPVVPSLYGYYLHKLGHLNKAVKYYEKALEINPENAKTAYSFSLLLIDLKNYDEALKYAKIAYQDKQAPQGLRKMLEKLGVWNN